MNRQFFTSLLLVSALASGCTSQMAKRPYTAPVSIDILAHLYHKQHQVMSLKAELSIDYLLKGDRIKTTTWLFSKRGGKLRAQTFHPVGNSIASEAACFNNRFTFLDTVNNCYYHDTCDGMLTYLSLPGSPDDLLSIAIGSVPVIMDAQPATPRWSSQHKAEIIDLFSQEGKKRQTLILQRKNGHWDLIHSTLFDSQEKPIWELTHKQFTTLAMPIGDNMRVPAKTRIIDHRHGTDIIIEWKNTLFNLAIPEDKFQLPVPQDLPECSKS